MKWNTETSVKVSIKAVCRKMKEEPASDRGRSFYTRLSNYCEIVERMSTSLVVWGLRPGCMRCSFKCVSHIWFKYKPYTSWTVLSTSDFVDRAAEVLVVARHVAVRRVITSNLRVEQKKMFEDIVHAPNGPHWSVSMVEILVSSRAAGVTAPLPVRRTLCMVDRTAVPQASRGSCGVDEATQR